MNRCIISILAVVIILAAFGPALAACNSNQPASYDDITAVMFERRGCNETLPEELKAHPALECSNYWLFFWNINPGGTYSQFSDRPDKGTYQVDTTLSQAIALLRKHNYFQLSPVDPPFTLDTRDSVMTVLRCGVVIRVMMITYGPDAATVQLFSDFDDLVTNAKKTKISNVPGQFPYTLLFDGQ